MNIYQSITNMAQSLRLSECKPNAICETGEPTIDSLALSRGQLIVSFLVLITILSLLYIFLSKRSKSKKRR